MSPTLQYSSGTAWAVVTGGSSGIGREYAEQLAGIYGYNLFLVSNEDEALFRAADEIRGRYGVEVRSLCTDLSAAGAARFVYDKLCEDKIDVTVLINNAGFLIFDAFVATPADRIHSLLNLHVVTLTELCRLIAADWIKKIKAGVVRRRYILNMSSMSAWMAMPSIQCYNATKAYVLNLSKALWYELREYDIRVMALAPGSTDTGLLPFPEKMSRVLRLTGITMKKSTLVKKALRKLFYSRRKVYVPGCWNSIIVPVINHLPDIVVLAAMKRLWMFDRQYMYDRI